MGFGENQKPTTSQRYAFGCSPRQTIVPVMDLTEEDIREFTKLWRLEFGETLSAADARREASLLLELYAVIARPLPTAASLNDYEVFSLLPKVDGGRGPTDHLD